MLLHSVNTLKAGLSVNVNILKDEQNIEVLYLAIFPLRGLAQ